MIATPKTTEWLIIRLIGLLVGWILWHYNLCRLFNDESIFIQKPVLFQTIQFSVSTVSMSKTIQFQSILFRKVRSLNISTKLNSQKHFYFELFSLVKQF